MLFVGTSFYNNWYLSRALRDVGWAADVLICKAEGAEIYAHGTDYYVDEVSLAEPTIPPSSIEDLRATSARYIANHLDGQEQPHRRSNPWSRWRASRLCRAAGRASPDERAALIEQLVQAMVGEGHTATLAAMYRALAELACPRPELADVRPIIEAVERYDVFHFTGVNSMRLLYFINPALFGDYPIGWDIDVLRRLGKRIVYTNIGCHDGVTQTSFGAWGPHSVCDICKWRDVPTVCSDHLSNAWGKLRNHLADYIALLGGNRADFNDSDLAHEVPEFYCLDPDLWRPGLEIPDEHRVDTAPGTVKIYHAVGDYKSRTRDDDVNIKTTHIIVPMIERLKAEGYPVELIFCTDVPNRDVRYYQSQADIVVDMLTFGFFGANIREAMMLGKPAVCFLRPEWLESMRREIPEYVDDLPVVSALPETIHDVLVDLITNPEKRAELGRRARDFALRWHSAEAGARRFDEIYTRLLSDGPFAPEHRTPDTRTPPKQ
ncbi:MAG: glycosyltransferase [Planctomycetota bacterium]